MKINECVVCKTKFENKNKYLRKTCSKKCNYILVSSKTKNRGKGKLTKKCVICNTEFTTWPSGDYKTCGGKCTHKLQSINATGKKKSEEHRKNISQALKNSDKAKKNWFKKGKDNPAYGRNQTGPANNNWKGGKTNTNQKRRNDPRLIEWRKKVMERDNFTCQDCGKRGYLHAHHIIPFSEDFSKAFDINNGKTLCVSCHEKVHGRFIGKFKLNS